MKKLVIAVDIDDVLIETAPLLVAYYNRKYGTNLQLKDMYAYDLRVWGVKTAHEAINRVEDYLQTDEFQKATPLLESVNSIKRLSKVHELHIITGRKDFLELATKDMLDQYFHKSFKSVTFTGFFGDKAVSKVDICRKIGADIFIDDHLAHVLDVADSGIAVLLFGGYPWNQAAKLPANVHRVINWQDAEEFIDAQS